MSTPNVRLAGVFAALFVAGTLARTQQSGGPAPAPHSDRQVRRAPALATPPAPVAHRRVYVLHSGVHTISSASGKNLAAHSLKDGLCKRGIAPRDIVVLDNPYPTASWYNMFPVECLTMFAASSLPGSKVAQDSYCRLHQALQAQQVAPEDDLVWVGHSAGGQMGLTMAYLAGDLDKFPDLARQTSPYHFDMVILLGTPIGSNHLPPEVKLRHYFSPQDKVVRWLARYGPVALRTLGYRAGITVMPPHLDPNDKIRVFSGVEHAYWDVEDRVLDRIVQETNPAYQPLWLSPLLAPGLEMSMMRLVSQALEDRFHLTFEDPPWSGK
jgi:hypothetical protein